MGMRVNRIEFKDSMSPESFFEDDLGEFSSRSWWIRIGASPVWVGNFWKRTGSCRILNSGISPFLRLAHSFDPDDEEGRVEGLEGPYSSWIQKSDVCDRERNFIHVPMMPR